MALWCHRPEHRVRQALRECALARRWAELGSQSPWGCAWDFAAAGGVLSPRVDFGFGFWFWFSATTSVIARESAPLCHCEQRPRDVAIPVIPVQR